MFKKEENNWINYTFNTEYKKVNFISWGPSNFPNYFNDDSDEDNLNNEILSPMKFVSCGDDMVHLWISNNNLINDFHQELIYRSNCEIKFVSWMKYIIYSYNTIAIGCEDGKIAILKEIDNRWLNTFNIENRGTLLSLSWSKCGTYLSINLNGKNKYYQENLDNKFEEIEMKK